MNKKNTFVHNIMLSMFFLFVFCIFYQKERKYGLSPFMHMGEISQDICTKHENDDIFFVFLATVFGNLDV